MQPAHCDVICIVCSALALQKPLMAVLLHIQTKPLCTLLFHLLHPHRHEQTITRVSASPGPGEYKVRSSLGGPAKTIATKLTPPSYTQQEQNPGPAEYEVFDSTIGVAGKLHM